MNYLSEIITICISLFCSATIGVILKNTVQKRIDELFKLREENQELKAQQQRIKEHDIISQVVKENLSPINERLANLENISELNTKGTVLLLRNVMSSTKDKAVKQGYITSDQKSDWLEDYNTYKSLGGNHFVEKIDVWKEIIEELPVK